MSNEDKLNVAVEALRKISNPKKYHHLEPNDYTQVACFMFVANEALKSMGYKDE